MATIVLVHGAWSSAFTWREMRGLLREAGHEFMTPSLTGLGDRVHLAEPHVDLETHVSDIEQFLFHEDLRDVVILAHSYGGIVATVLADRAAERIAKLIYLDAFVPDDGKSMLDYLPPAAVERIRQAVAGPGEGWKAPPNPLPPDTPTDRVEWLTARRHWRPFRTFSSPARLTGAVARIPTSYIYCKVTGPVDIFAQFYDRARGARWPTYELDASHNPHITMPETLAALVCEIVGE